MMTILGCVSVFCCEAACWLHPFVNIKTINIVRLKTAAVSFISLSFGAQYCSKASEFKSQEVKFHKQYHPETMMRFHGERLEAVGIWKNTGFRGCSAHVPDATFAEAINKSHHEKASIIYLSS